ncbi:MAG: acetyl-CoA carboxylase biotin carboxyl carrier protein [Planctomycetota bacterium]|nr:MAG: acetyl-CoA carboxylase biotin carboxyl carrier protein [Planctomycetota bacterium]
MSEDTKRRNNSLAKLKRLVNLMKEHSLVELELEEENFRVRLVKAQAGAAAAAGPGAPAGAPREAAAEAAEKKKESEEEKFHPITSPIVGTFYRAPAPDAKPYVEVGDHVEEDTVVCIVEAMKVMNELKAGCRGTIVKILAENAQTVEYGQTLFLVRPD